VKFGHKSRKVDLDHYFLDDNIDIREAIFADFDAGPELNITQGARVFYSSLETGLRSFLM
jgi:hypothetical protein